MTSGSRRRLEGAEEEVRRLMAEMPTRSAVGMDREELRRHLLVLDRLIRKAMALGEAIEAARAPPPGTLH